MLLIDIGNSRIKWAFWQNNQMQGHRVYRYQSDTIEELLEAHVEEFRLHKVYVCSVVSAQVNQIIVSWFASRLQIKVELVETQQQQLGVTNAYQQPDSLGTDRWLAMLSAYHRYKNAVCVIDCGTAVTVDLIDATGKHMGGLIMPGIQMMQRGLGSGTQGVGHTRSQSLSMLSKNTQDGVAGGCFNLLVCGLDGLYEKYRKLINTELVCVLTGGDGESVARMMESNCYYEEDLILYGLYLVAQSRG